MEVVDLFKRQDTRDELGIGAVRDTISELLAPGISTIQTRARYFFFIPWVYQSLETRRTRSAQIAHWAREDELRLAVELQPVDHLADQGAALENLDLSRDIKLGVETAVRRGRVDLAKIEEVLVETLDFECHSALVDRRLRQAQQQTRNPCRQKSRSISPDLRRDGNGQRSSRQNHPREQYRRRRALRRSQLCGYP